MGDIGSLDHNCPKSTFSQIFFSHFPHISPTCRLFVYLFLVISPKNSQISPKNIDKDSFINIANTHTERLTCNRCRRFSAQRLCAIIVQYFENSFGGGGFGNVWGKMTRNRLTKRQNIYEKCGGGEGECQKFGFRAVVVQSLLMRMRRRHVYSSMVRTRHRFARTLILLSGVPVVRPIALPVRQSLVRIALLTIASSLRFLLTTKPLT